MKNLNPQNTTMQKMCVREGFQGPLDFKYMLLGYLWQEEGNQNGSLFESKEYKTVSFFGTKKKTLQNLTNILNHFYLKMFLEKSNILWQQKFTVMYSWAVLSRHCPRLEREQMCPDIINCLLSVCSVVLDEWIESIIFIPSPNTYSACLNLCNWGNQLVS